MNVLQLDLYPFLHKTSGISILYPVQKSSFEGTRKTEMTKFVSDILTKHTKHVEDNCLWEDDNSEQYELSITWNQFPCLVFHTDVARFCIQNFNGTKNQIWRQCIGDSNCSDDENITDKEAEIFLMTEKPIPTNGWYVL